MESTVTYSVESSRHLELQNYCHYYTNHPPHSSKFFTPAKNQEMKSCVQTWKKQSMPLQTWSACNKYFTKNCSTQTLYFSEIARRVIYQRTMAYISAILEPHNSIFCQSPFEVAAEFRNFISLTIQRGNSLRSMAYQYLPDTISGKFKAEKMSNLLFANPFEYIGIINNFLIGLALTSESILAMANFQQAIVSTHPELCSDINIQRYIKDTIALEMPDIDASLIRIIKTSNSSAKAIHKHLARTQSLKNIRLFIQPLCQDNHVASMWDRILNSDEILSELTTCHGSTLNRECGFNLNKVCAIILMMYNKNLLPFSKKTEIIHKLSTSKVKVPASYLNPSAIEKLENKEIVRKLLFSSQSPH